MSGSIFIEVKSLAGSNFIVAGGIIAVQQVEPTKCNIMLAGGVTVPCNEAARDIAAKVDAAMKSKQETKPKQETGHGHANA